MMHRPCRVSTLMSTQTTRCSLPLCVETWQVWLTSVWDQLCDLGITIYHNCYDVCSWLWFMLIVSIHDVFPRIYDYGHGFWLIISDLWFIKRGSSTLTPAPHNEANCYVCCSLSSCITHTHTHTHTHTLTRTHTDTRTHRHTHQQDDGDRSTTPDVSLTAVCFNWAIFKWSCRFCCSSFQ